MMFSRKKEETFSKMKRAENEEDSYIKKTQVVIIAGGLGTRLRHRTGEEIPKPLLKVGGRTLIDICVQNFVKNGFDSFVFLLGYEGNKVKDHIKRMSYNIDEKFSLEPKLLGKAGAIKFALDKGIIDRKRPCIISYPDDIVLMEDFPRQLVRRHLIGLKRGCKATVVRVKKTKYPYGVIHVDDEGVVIDFEEKPFVNLPANVGIYFLEPEVYDIIDEVVDLSKAPIDFENVVAPELVSRRLLFSFTIPHDAWIPVNDEKEYRRAEKVFSKKL